jgi:branched-subunit amino acid ABC-type transport system permease component
LVVQLSAFPDRSRRGGLAQGMTSLLAIREDEVAAEAMGVDTTGYKVRAFVVSSFFAGVAGGASSGQALATAGSSSRDRKVKLR